MVSAFDATVPNGRKDHQPMTMKGESKAASSSPHGVSQRVFSSVEERKQETDPRNQDEHNDVTIKEEEQRGLNTTNMDCGDTEDEEVKIHCIGGISCVKDSDMSDGARSGDGGSESETDDTHSNTDCESDVEGAGVGLVNFVSAKVEKTPSSPVIQRPTPVLRASRQKVSFSPVPRDKKSSATSSDSDNSTSSSSSSGARGIGLSLESLTPRASWNGRDASDESSGSGEDHTSTGSDSSDTDGSDASQNEDSQSEKEDSDLDGDDSEHIQGEASDDKLSSLRDGEDPVENDCSRDILNVQGPIHETTGTWAVGSTSEEVSGHLRRPSLSVDEIEDLIDSDNGAVVSGTGVRDKGNKVSEEELIELFSDSLEFDYWSSETLEAVVETLSSVNTGDSTRSEKEDYPIRLPARDDADFWVDRMGLVTFPESTLKHFLDENPSQRVSAARRMHDAFSAEMLSLDIARVPLERTEAAATETATNSSRRKPALFVGSFSSAESRLALAALNIKRVIQISYHPLDELWVGDGVEYSSHILPSLGDGNGARVFEAIEEGAEEVAGTLRQGNTQGTVSSVLVTCSTGDEHSCAVCALYLAKHHHIASTAAMTMIANYRSSCRIDPEWLNAGDLSENGQLQRNSKRVLSSNMLSSLNPMQSIGFESPKRMRCTEDPPLPSGIPLLPALSLGPAAYDQEQPSREALKMRGSDEYVSSSTEEEEEREQDLRLSEELEESEEVQDKPSTPVPLLTPPASPVRVESEGGPTTVCEWPSNLAVDSAMTAAIDLRPLSPRSLQRQEEEEERRIQSNGVGKISGNSRLSKPVPSTTLTPMIKGICVKFD